MKVFASQIVDDYLGCPFCMANTHGKLSCCGEPYFERILVIADRYGEMPYLETEIEIIDHRPNDSVVA